MMFVAECKICGQEGTHKTQWHLIDIGWVKKAGWICPDCNKLSGKAVNVSIYIQKFLLDIVDDMVEFGLYNSRSEAFRKYIIEGLKKDFSFIIDLRKPDDFRAVMLEFNEKHKIIFPNTDG